MKNLKPLVLCFLAVVLVSCKGGKPENFDYGKVVDHTYSNEYFGMSIDLPVEWYVQTQAELEDMAKAGAELLGDDMVTKAKLKASEVNTANLLSVFEFDPKTNVGNFNSNLIIIAENIAMAVGVNSGEDYLKATKKILQQTQLNYSFGDDSTGTKTFGGQEFAYMEAVLNHQGVEVKQRYYSTVSNDFSFNVIISYMDEEQKESLIDILESIDF